MEIGIKSHKTKQGIDKKGNSKFTIDIGIKSLFKFFEYIGKIPEEIKESYGYKWPTKKEIKYLKKKYGSLII
jgi:hypothetical protein